MYHRGGTRGGGDGSRGARHHHYPSRNPTKPAREPSHMHNKSRQYDKPISSSIEQEINLITNAYSLCPSTQNYKIFEYDLIIAPSGQCKDLPAKVMSRAFVSRSIRKLIMEKIAPRLTSPICPAGSILIEPNLEKIYSKKEFAISSESTSTVQGEFIFEDVPVETDLINNLSIDMMIKLSKSYTSNPASYNTSLLSSILHHQLLIDMLRYGPVYYMMRSDLAKRDCSNRLDLISHHFMGISISGARRCMNEQTIVVINCSHSYITKSYRLIDLLACFIAGRPIDDIQLDHSMSNSSQTLDRIRMPELASITGSEDWFASFCAILSGFKCQAPDNQGKYVNLRFVLSDCSAADLFLDEKTTVQQLYRSLNVNLNYPNLPCLKSRSSNHPFYPLELCSLLPGQKVPMFRLSTTARNHLVTVNKQKPNFSRHFSCQAREEVSQLSKNQFKSFGIQLSAEPVEASGQTLIKPILQFKNYFLEPQRDHWESGVFYKSVDLIGNWCVVDTVGMDLKLINDFFQNFSAYSRRHGFNMGPPYNLTRTKNDILEQNCSIERIIQDCRELTGHRLRFIMFVIDSSSTSLNRLIHLSFDENPNVTATCLRVESIQNVRQHRSIHRTLVHKLNARLGGTNVTYNTQTWSKLDTNCTGLMVVGLDVTHPDNELSGVSIVGCAYTYTQDLFRHRSLVWPQAARVEIISKMDTLMQRLLNEYKSENKGHLPKNIIIYRDGVSHEEFNRVRSVEISKATAVIDEIAKRASQQKPILSYIIAQKRHTMRFFRMVGQDGEVNNPPGGTLIKGSVVASNGCEFYLYSNTSPQATARPLHYHVLLNGLGMENLQKLTYYLCFNFGKCSSSLSMPSSLRYAHNAAYDARNRVIAAKEFDENRFYTTKFFC